MRLERDGEQWQRAGTGRFGLAHGVVVLSFSRYGGEPAGSVIDRRITLIAHIVYNQSWSRSMVSEGPLVAWRHRQ